MKKPLITSVLGDKKSKDERTGWVNRRDSVTQELLSISFLTESLRLVSRYWANKRLLMVGPCRAIPAGVTASSIASNFVPSYTAPLTSVVPKQNDDSNDFNNTFRQQLNSREDTDAPSVAQNRFTPKFASAALGLGNPPTNAFPSAASLEQLKAKVTVHVEPLEDSGQQTGINEKIETNADTDGAAKKIAHQTAPLSDTPAAILQPTVIRPTSANSLESTAFSAPPSEELNVEASSTKTERTTARQAAGSSRSAPTKQQDNRKTSPRIQTRVDSNSVDVVQLSVAGQQATSPVSDGKSQNNLESDHVATSEPSENKTPATNEVVAPCNTDKPIPVSGELAIAMRVTPAADKPSTGLSAVDSAPDIAVGSSINPHPQATPVSATGSTPHHEPTAMSPAAVTTDTGTSIAGQTSATDKTKEATGTRATDFETELNKALSQPVRGAHVQITGAEDQRVDIRLQERGGVMSVTLRSDDASLTRVLQDHTSELTARLSTEHFQTDLWTPSTSKTSQPFTNNQSGNSQNQQNTHSGQQQPNQRQNSKQNQQPDWVEEFENNPTAFNRRIEYTWHQ